VPGCSAGSAIFLHDPRFVLVIALSLTSFAWTWQACAQSAACEAAIDRAERTDGLPPGLLAAIGRVESGRTDPVEGAIRPWPWTINANGIGRVFDTKDAAIAAVRSLQAEDVRSIDVGCLQVNLQFHPTAFTSLDQAFDPQANAAYAARFLRELFAGSQDWQVAAASYHSRTADVGAAYRQLVMVAWKPGLASHVDWPATVPTIPPPMHPFAALTLSGGSGAPVAPGSGATERLLALASDCAGATPGEASQWVAPVRSPKCGRSPFATVSLLRRVLAAGFP
jgi:hypothetical protein